MNQAAWISCEIAASGCSWIEGFLRQIWFYALSLSEYINLFACSENAFQITEALWMASEIAVSLGSWIIVFRKGFWEILLLKILFIFLHLIFDLPLSLQTALSPSVDAVVCFFATWCPHSRRFLEKFAKAAEESRGKRKVQYLWDTVVWNGIW